MKKLITLTLLISTLNLLSQTDSSLLKHRHEVGVDITGLLSQFFNLYNSNTSINTPNPTYLITYRYHFSKSNIRFGVGGTYFRNPSTGYTVNGEPQTFYNTSTHFSIRIGYELVSELSKKWQAFYGLDFRPSIANDNNEAQYSQGNYIYGYKRNTTTYGLAPIIGVRFRINERVSITTEASFSYYVQNSTQIKTYISQNTTLYPPKPDDKSINTKTVSASFNQPLYLILTLRL
jgi:hypothetical protein